MTLEETLKKQCYRNISIVHNTSKLCDTSLIINLDNNTLTEEGRKEWKDVLQADVVSIKNKIGFADIKEISL